MDNSSLENVECAIHQSEFGEWIIVAGIGSIWKRYGKRAQVSSLFSLSDPETLSVVDPSYYAKRFLTMSANVLKP